MALYTRAGGDLETQQLCAAWPEADPTGRARFVEAPDKRDFFYPRAQWSETPMFETDGARRQLAAAAGRCRAVGPDAAERNEAMFAR